RTARLNPQDDAATMWLTPGLSPGVRCFPALCGIDRHAESQTRPLLRPIAAGVDLRGGTDLWGAGCAYARDLPDRRRVRPGQSLGEFPLQRNARPAHGGPVVGHCRP